MGYELESTLNPGRKWVRTSGLTSFQRLGVED